MTKQQKRFLVEFPDDIDELIIAHPGGHIDVIEVDRGDGVDEDESEDDDALEEDVVSPERGSGTQGRSGRRR
jgi:hypothetical protein